MKKLVLTVLALIALTETSAAAAAEKIVTPRFPEDLVRIQTTASQSVYTVKEVIQKDATIELLAYDEHAPRISIELADAKTAEILASTFSWNTEMSLQINAGQITGEALVVSQEQVLFEDVDGAMGDSSRGSDGSRLVTIDALVKWIQR